MLWSVLFQAPAWARTDPENADRDSQAAAVIYRDDGAPIGDPADPALDLSMLKVTADESFVGGVAVVTTFAAAVGGVMIFVPPTAQAAAFVLLLAIAATPIDGLIIGGGAIAGYRYLKREALDQDLEYAAPSWSDGWRYSVN